MLEQRRPPLHRTVYRSLRLIARFVHNDSAVQFRELVMSDSLPAASRMRAERRVVTALFADIANSTAIVEQIDPEDARELVGETLSLVIRNRCPRRNREGPRR